MVTPFCWRTANSHQKKNWTIIQGWISVVAYFPQLEYHQNISDWYPEDILIGQRHLLDHQGIITGTKKYMNIHSTAGE